MAINDPRDIPGLLVWYSAEAETGYADGQHIPTVTDLSGNGNHGTATTTSQKWNATGGPNGGAYFSNPPKGGTGVEGFRLPDGVMGAASSGEAAIYLLPGGGLWDLGSSTSSSHFTYSDTIYDDFGTTSRKTVGTNTNLGWQRYEAMSKPGQWTAWLDGVQKFTTTTNTVGWAPQPGIGYGSASFYLSGFSLFVLYGRDLTTTERADLDAWMAAHPNGGTSGPLTPTIALAGTTPAVTGAFNLAADPTVTLAGTTPAATGSFGVSVVVPDVAADLAGAAPAVAGSFSLTESGVAFVDLAGTAPAVFGSFGGTASGPAVEVATDSVNQVNGMTLVTEWLVEVTPPITEPKRKRGHDYATATSISSPTFVDGRPT